MRRKRISSAVSIAALCCSAEAARAQSAYTQLAAFNGSNGAGPTSGLVADSSGNLYGSAEFGGANGQGDIFELSGTNHSTFTTLATFNGSSNGANPFGSLYVDPSGNIYGTTVNGGAGNGGTVFELSGTNHSTFATLVNFNSSSGTNPYTGVTGDAAGNLYGTTESGGPGTQGTAFELAANHATYTTLVAFNGSNGGYPFAGGLVLDPAGNLYGTTAEGGTAGEGTVFRLSGPGHNTFTSLVSFDGPDGNTPYATLAIGPDGSLYGTTAGGGTLNDGVVFRLSGPTLQTVTALFSFNQSDGATPYSTPIFDAAGNLFGTTSQGGPLNTGTVFELSGNNYQTLTSLVTFRSGTALGSGPRGPLYADAGGNLYGTTVAGGQVIGSGTPNNGSAYQLSGSGFIFAGPPIVVTANTSFTLPAASATATGITVTAIQGLTVGPGAYFNVAVAANFKFRQIINLPHTFNISGTSRVNFGNNDGDVGTGLTNSGTITYSNDYGYTNIAAATSAVAAGYNNGNWNGPSGITNSSAAADTTHTTAYGVIQNNQSGTPLFSSSSQFDGTVPGPGDILFKYTYYGDANLDGKVDGSDYTLIDAGNESGGTLTGWYYGDFNYDGVVDGSDYSLMDNSFNNQAGNLSTTALAAGPTDLAADAAPAAAVPEPAALIALPAAVWLLRRGRAGFPPE